MLHWANLRAADPAYNLATVETNLLTPDADPARRTDPLRDTFRTACHRVSGDWDVDASPRNRRHLYRLTDRLDAMACLPLRYVDADAETRVERAAEHRPCVREYLSLGAESTRHVFSAMTAPARPQELPHQEVSVPSATR